MSNRQWDDSVDPARVAIEALIKSGDTMADRIEELEAKLAKAVEALEGMMMHMPDFADTVWIDARTTLAELKGETDAA